MVGDVSRDFLVVFVVFKEYHYHMATKREYDWRKAPICCLCGQPFEADPLNVEAERSRQHAVSKQFFPKELRTDSDLNLWMAAAHKGCNGSVKSYEEYFYHAFWPHVAEANPQFSQLMLRDIQRRAVKPQSRTWIRSILEDAGPVTKGGIILPPNVIAWGIKPYETQQVAIATAQALSCFHDNQFIPKESCVDIRLCLNSAEVPEMYSLLATVAPGTSPCPSVFSYWSFQMERQLKLYALLFWNSFLFGLTFDTSQ
jgi:hypothetical protein